MERREIGLKCFCLILGLFLASFLLKGVANAQAPIKLGVISAWDFAGGQGVKRGATMAIDDVNAAGGVLGRKIQAFVYDNKGNTDEAKRVTERLLYNDKVDAIVGFWRSELAIACQPLIMEAKKIVFLTGASAPILTKERIKQDYNRYKYTFCTIGSSDRFAKLFSLPIIVARDKLGLSKIAFLAEKTAFLVPTVEYVNKEFKDMIVYFGEFSPTASDFSMELTKAKAAGANNLFALSSGPAGTPLVKQWYDMQLPMLHTGYSVQAQDANFWKTTEGKCEAVITAHVGAGAGLPITKKSRPWYEKYKTIYGEYPISLMDPVAYDAVWAWVEGVRLAGTTESDAVVRALESKQFKYVGVSAVLEGFDDIHAPYGGGWKPGEAWGFCLIQWLNGKREVIHPENVKTADITIPDRLKKLMGK